MIITISYIVCAVFTLAIILGKFDPDLPRRRLAERRERQRAIDATRLIIPQSTYNADPEFFDRQAKLAGVTLQVKRSTGGWSETHPDGGYGHVCTRQDLAGQR